LNKLSGYFSNSLELSANFRADFAFAGRANMGGVAVNRIDTLYGTMNVAYDPHLDGSPIKILALNMNYVGYRPLVGNGVNRDTTIYVGVQTLESTGVDKRIDLIQTEAGFEFQMPEAHALWKI
jgi:hypothetical protein